MACSAQDYQRQAMDLEAAWFPGRVIGGITLIVGPALWLVAMILRYAGSRSADWTAEQRAWFDAQEFAAPEQLAAYAHAPGLVTAAYAAFAAGCLVLIFGMITFACRWSLRRGHS